MAKRRNLPKTSYQVAKRIESDIAAIQAAKDSFNVLPNVLQQYEPPARIYELTEYMLATGEDDPDHLCDMLVMSPEEYRKLMRSPKNVAWMAATLRNHIPYLLGRLDLVMFKKALGGNVPAYKAVLERFNEGGVRRSMVAHVHAGTDTERMTDRQLEDYVSTKKREQFGEEARTETSAPSPGGTGETEVEDPDSALPPAREAAPLPRGGEELPPTPGESGEPLG